jgi:hypothetical protein
MKVDPSIHKSFGIFGENPGTNAGVNGVKSALENIMSMIKLLRTPDSVRAGGALVGTYLQQSHVYTYIHKRIYIHKYTAILCMHVYIKKCTFFD